MGLAEIQGVLARLYIDAMLRDRFFAAPLVVGAQLGSAPTSRETWRGFPAARSTSSPSRSGTRGATRCAGSSRTPRGRSAEGGLPNYSSVCQRVIAPRLESRPRRRGRVCRGGPKMGRQDVEPPWAIDLAEYELTWRQATRSGRAPIMRIFRYPVGRLAIASQSEPILPRTTLAVWWRPICADLSGMSYYRCRELACDAREMATRRGGVRHLLTQGKSTVNTNRVPVSVPNTDAAVLPLQWARGRR